MLRALTLLVVLVATALPASAQVFLWPWLRISEFSSFDLAQVATFGHSMALKGDRMVIGAPNAIYGVSGAGAAYFLRRESGVWAQEQKVIRSGVPGASDYFGDAVAIDDDLALIGIRAHHVAAVFERINTVWTPIVELGPWTTGDSRQTLGVSGGILALGNSSEDLHGVDSGAVRVFERVSGVWTLQQTIAPSDARAGDIFGRALAIHADTMLIARGPNGSLGEPSSVIAFHRIAGVWQQGATIRPSDAALWDEFGASIAWDGATAIIGAPYGSPTPSVRGAAYVFERQGESWAQTARLTPAAPPPPATIADFGRAVAGDSSVVVVGAPRSFDGGLSRGAAFVFNRQGATWWQRLWDRPTGLGQGDSLGASAAFDGTNAFAGAPGLQVAGFVRMFSDEPPPCPGDANGDNRVDFVDLNVVLSDFASPEAGAQSDLNRDGVTDFLDLNIVLSYYSSTC